MFTSLGGINWLVIAANGSTILWVDCTPAHSFI